MANQMHGEFWAESALMHEWKMWDRKIPDEMSGPKYVGPNVLAQKRRYTENTGQENAAVE